jgi:hypothetical protein
VAKTDVSPGLCVPELLARSSLLGPIFLADVSIGRKLETNRQRL